MRSLVLAVALLLAVAPAAAAKEITKAEVCGPDGCTAVADVAVAPILGNGGPPRTPPTAAPYYDVRLTVDEGDQDFTLELRRRARAARDARRRRHVDADGAGRGGARHQDRGRPHALPGERDGRLGGRARPEARAGEHRQPAAGAKPGSLLPSGGWPEGVIVALIAVAAAFVARGVWVRGAARRA